MRAETARGWLVCAMVLGAWGAAATVPRGHLELPQNLLELQGLAFGWLNSSRKLGMSSALLKWKEDISNINITAHMDAFRDFADVVGDAPSALVEGVSQAWSRVNHSLALSASVKSHAVVQYTSKLSPQGVYRILRAQRQVSADGLHHHLIYVVPAATVDEHSRRDLALLKDLLSPESYTVLYQSDLTYCLDACFSLERPLSDSAALRIAQQSDYVLWAWLFKKGFVQRQCPEEHCHAKPGVLTSIGRSLRRLFPHLAARQRGHSFQIHLPARFFWMVPLRYDWKGDLFVLLERLDEEYSGASDLVSFRANSSADFGALDRRRQAPALLSVLQALASGSEPPQPGHFDVQPLRLARYSQSLLSYMATNVTQTGGPLDANSSLMEAAIVHHKRAPPSLARPFARPLAFYDAHVYASARGYVRFSSEGLRDCAAASAALWEESSP